jgi:hypothetical protein
MAVLSGSQIGLMNELSVDTQFERKVKVQQIVQKGDLELLIAIGCSHSISRFSARKYYTHLPGLACHKRSHYRRTLLLRVESFQLVLIALDGKAQLWQMERHGSGARVGGLRELRQGASDWLL